MKKRIAILIFVFISTFSIVFAIFFGKVASENHGKIKFYYEVSFDARINNENLLGSLRKPDGTIGEEVHIPIQTEVHVIAIKKNGDILVGSPILIEIEGERREVFLDYISMENIDEATYAKELLRSKIQETEQKIDLRIRKHLINSIIAAIVLFAVFSLIFLLIDKKCDSDRKYRKLFCFLLVTAILSLLFLFVYIQYMKGIR